MSTLFKEKGLIQCVLPREHIRPLMILQKINAQQGEIIGSVEELFEDSAVGLPLDRQNEKVTNFALDNTVLLDASVGASFLDALTANLGDAAIQYNCQHSDTVAVTYKNVLRDSIKAEIGLHNFICASIPTLKKNNGYYNQLIQGNLYIITAIYKSTNFNITIKDSSSGAIKLNLNLKSCLDAQLAANKQSNAIESIANNGENMIFAIRAKRIIYKAGNLFLKPYFGLENPDITKVLGAERMESLSNENDLFYLK
jgi:hypothetical protein